MSLDSRFKPFTKNTVQMLRPYEEGESMDGISVWDGDVLEVGGMVAINLKDMNDQWYVAKKFVEDNYIEAIA